MLLTELTLENYGVYRGFNKLNISCKPNTPIVLICGFNGNGKTTILEAMMVSLYGNLYLGSQSTKKEYDDFIYSKMHRSSGTVAKQSSISLSFQFHHDGKDDVYTIKRTWNRNEGKILESIFVQKNDEEMDMDNSQWRQFIEGLIPYGIAKLFFFDGDKMFNIATWDKQGRNLELKKSFDMLLGTELVKRLQSDLSVYVMRNSKKTDPTLSAQQDEYMQEKKDIEESIKEMREEQSRKSQELESLVSKTRILETDVLNMGGGYARKRETMIGKRGIMVERIREIRESLHNALLEDTFLGILPDEFINKISKKLTADIELTGAATAARILANKINFAKEEIVHDQNLSKLESATVLSTLDLILHNCKPESDPNFDLSPNVRNELIKLFSSNYETIDKLNGLSGLFASNNKLLIQLETDLANVPKDDEIGPMITDLNNLNVELGLLKGEIDELERNISSKESSLRMMRSRLEKIIKSTYKNEKGSSGIKFAAKMQKTLDLYYSKLKEKKIIELENNMLEVIQILLRKQIGKLTIDRDNFSISVYDKNGDISPEGLSSMGEKQIVGTALLWALARTSGRALPFVIDTPLARLDGIHRANLIKSFYPFASHQITILSTDKEIGENEYAALKDHISHTYSLLHDDSLSTTSIKNGYFVEAQKIAA